MLAPMATLKRAAARAHNAVHTAEQLAEDADIISASSEESDEEAPEELEPEEAREVVEEVYEPLMGRKAGRSRSRNRHDHEHRAEGQGRKVRKLEVYLSYGCFLILGACVLLPWNSEIVASTYFGARLAGSPYEASFSSWLALTFTSSNLCFLALANATQQGASLAKRISVSIVVMTGVLSLFIVSTRFSSIEPNTFFTLLILSTIALAASASYLQNATVALSSRFGPLYLQGILSGQGAVGLAVALLQFVSAYTASPPSLAPTTISEAIRTSAFVFFLTVAAFSALSFLAHLLLTRLPLYRLVIRSASPTASSPKKTPSLRIVERKVRTLGLSIGYIFLVTLSVFPSITSTITSVHAERGGLRSPNLFVPMAFIFFAAGDWIGRAMPQVERLVFRDRRALAGASVARTVFIPLFLMCNVQAGSITDTPIINSDTIFLALMLLFALSNGYTSTLVMLAAVVDPLLEEDEIDIAATCLAFYLTSGLAVGSLISFPVRAAVCRCNPFL